MTGWFPRVIARALVPVAISYIRKVQPLYVFHVGDCFVVLRTPRNDGLVSRVIASELCERGNLSREELKNLY